MQAHVLLKIARQVEGEYILLQPIKAMVDRVSLNEFVKTYNFAPTETIGDIGYVVELGIIEVDVEDLDKYATAATPSQQFDLNIVWKNLRHLPIAEIVDTPFPTLKNPEILDWINLQDEKRHGKGLVWVEKDKPLTLIDAETFVPKKYYGELRFSQAFNKGRYGPLQLEPAEVGDLRGEEEI